MAQLRDLTLTAFAIAIAGMTTACGGDHGTRSGNAGGSAGTGAMTGGATHLSSTLAGGNGGTDTTTRTDAGVHLGGGKSTDNSASSTGGTNSVGVGGSPVTATYAGSAGNAGTASVYTRERNFLMGSTPFFATSSAFPDWRFEDMADRDLLSLHIDDFLGIPWDHCSEAGCVDLPATWVAKWRALADQAQAANKPVYLSVSPLGDRKTLARRVLADGTTEDRWLPSAVVDANGCYLFGTDANATKYRSAYTAFLKYLIELFRPSYFSPGIEINIPFTSCASQKSAWIAWYGSVHQAVKAAYPSLIVFPTFQLEHLYGVATTEIACANGLTYDQCFAQRLTEATAIPGDRIAFSTYPITWKYVAAANFTYPKDTYARVKAATTRKIWISETGWSAVPIRSSYKHGTVGSCGDYRIPTDFDAPGLGSIGLANDTEHAAYISWLLNEAQRQNFETVVWWLNRDYLDGAVADTCPCSPATGDTCKLSDLFYAISADAGDFAMRLFANMGLRRYDGTPRPGHATWKAFITRRYAQP